MFSGQILDKNPGDSGMMSKPDRNDEAHDEDPQA